MVAGTVTLSLADVDLLRKEVKDRDETIKILEKKVIEVGTDKRVMKVKVMKPITKNDFTYSLNYSGIEHDKRYYNGVYSTEELIKKHINIYPILSAPPVKNDVEFINFDDAKQELKEILEKEYQEEIGSLRSDKKHQNIHIEQIKKEHLEDILRVSRKNEDDTKILIDKITEWQKKYDDLEANKKELSEIEHLKADNVKLRTTLLEYKNKSFWERVFKK